MPLPFAAATRQHPKKAQRPGERDLDWFYGLKDSLLLRADARQDPLWKSPDWASWVPPPPLPPHVHSCIPLSY